MNTLHRAGFAALALLASLSMGCPQGPPAPTSAPSPPGPSTKAGAPKPKVAFVSNNAESFWTIAEAGTKKAAEEFDVEVLFRKPEQGDAGRQKEIIDTVLNQGIKAIAISVIDPKNQNNYLKEVAGRVSLLTQDNDAPDSGRLCYIGTDNY